MRLAGELKALRTTRGLQQRDVCDALQWSPTKMSRIESGQVRLSREDLELLLDLYGGVDDGRRERFLQLANDSGRRGWYSSYDDVFSTAFPGLEDEAQSIWIYEPDVVPGLLQTTAYTRALVSAGMSRDPQSAQRRVEARRHRRAILDRPAPPTVQAFIGEPVLLWQVGGPQVLREQLLELWQFATTAPNVTVQVVPFSSGEGLNGPLTVFSFEGGTEIGHAETGFGGGTYLESAADLGQIRLAREGIERHALTQQESADLIATAADKYRE
jgi:transcriptional regulator with XRE-family HTH domain